MTSGLAQRKSGVDVFVGVGVWLQEAYIHAQCDVCGVLDNFNTHTHTHF